MYRTLIGSAETRKICSDRPRLEKLLDTGVLDVIAGDSEQCTFKLL